MVIPPFPWWLYLFNDENNHPLKDEDWIATFNLLAIIFFAGGLFGIGLYVVKIYTFFKYHRIIVDWKGLFLFYFQFLWFKILCIGLILLILSWIAEKILNKIGGKNDW